MIVSYVYARMKRCKIGEEKEAKISHWDDDEQAGLGRINPGKGRMPRTTSLLMGLVEA
jgi:hypothetical protein